MSIENIYPSTRGGKWHGMTIKHMLENPLCKGTAYYKDNKFKNKELALV